MTDHKGHAVKEPVDAGPAVPTRKQPFCYAMHDQRKGRYVYRVMCRTEIDGRECHFTAEHVDGSQVRTSKHIHGHAVRLAHRWTEKLIERPELAEIIIMESRL